MHFFSVRSFALSLTAVLALAGCGGGGSSAPSLSGTGTTASAAAPAANDLQTAVTKFASSMGSLGLSSAGSQLQSRDRKARIEQGCQVSPSGSGSCTVYVNESPSVACPSSGYIAESVLMSGSFQFNATSVTGNVPIQYTESPHACSYDGTWFYYGDQNLSGAGAIAFTQNSASINFRIGGGFAVGNSSGAIVQRCQFSPSGVTVSVTAGADGVPHGSVSGGYTCGSQFYPISATI